MSMTLHDRSTRLAVRPLAAVLVVGALAVIVLRAWASVSTGWTGLTLPEATNGVVSDVRTGSSAWLNGVRAGDSYEMLADGGSLEIRTAASVLGLSTALPHLPIQPAVVAVVILVVGLVVRLVLPTVGALVLLTAVLVAGDDLLGWLPIPLLALVLLGPALAAALLALERMHGGSRLAMVALAVLLVVGGATAALSFAAEPLFADLWQASRLLPLMVAAVLVLETLVAIAVTLQRARSTRVPTHMTLLRSTAVGQRALRLAEEDERDRSAQRIHDQVLPGLALVLAGPATPPTERMRVASIADNVRTAIMDDQLLVLRHEGLAEGIQDVIDRASPPSLRASVVAKESGGRPPWDVEVAAYRIAQEAINNVVHHADAEYLEVRVEANARHLRLEVDDDGIGIPGEVAHGRAGHLGIREMGARARDVGGSLTVKRRAIGGTRVTFSWPT